MWNGIISCRTPLMIVYKCPVYLDQGDVFRDEHLAAPLTHIRLFLCNKSKANSHKLKHKHIILGSACSI